MPRPASDVRRMGRRQFMNLVLTWPSPALLGRSTAGPPISSRQTRPGRWGISGQDELRNISSASGCASPPTRKCERAVRGVKGDPSRPILL